MTHTVDLGPFVWLLGIALLGWIPAGLLMLLLLSILERPVCWLLSRWEDRI